MQTQGWKNRATAVVTVLGVALFVLLSLGGQGHAQVAGATLTGIPTAPASYGAQCAPFSGIPPLVGSPIVYCSNLLGNLSRNSVIGPGLVNVDFSVFKNFPIARISDSFNVQFRTEMFNVFNHANFNSPIDNSNIFDSTGLPVNGAGRIVQGDPVWPQGYLVVTAVQILR